MKTSRCLSWIPATIAGLMAIGAFAAEAPSPIGVPPPEKTISLIDFYLKAIIVNHCKLSCHTIAAAVFILDTEQTKLRAWR